MKSLNGSARAQDWKTLVYEGREYVSDKAKTSAFIQEYATVSGRKSDRSSRRAVRELRSGVRRLLGSPRQELEQAFASEELATALKTVKAGKAGGPERLIANSLSWWMEAKSLFSPWKAGFRKRRCTTDQCLRLSQFASDGFQSTNKERTVLMLFDYSKAYDTVWRTGLLQKMLDIGVPLRFVQWTTAWLTNRIARLGRTFDKLVRPPCASLALLRIIFRRLR